MNIRLKLLVVIILGAFAGCSSDDAPAVVEAKFSVASNIGETPFELEITNESTGATDYSWTFIGASTLNSFDKEPEGITYTSGGVYTVMLEAYNNDNIDTAFVSIFPRGEEMQEYYEVLMGPDYGYIFSTSTGKVYTDEEILAENSDFKDIAYVNFVADNGGRIKNITSPHRSSMTIGGTNTKYRDLENQETLFGSPYEDSFPVTVESFDDIDNAALFKNMVFDIENLVMDASRQGVIIFENSRGKRGIIRIREVIGSNVSLDIKIQK